LTVAEENGLAFPPDHVRHAYKYPVLSRAAAQEVVYMILKGSHLCSREEDHFGSTQRQDSREWIISRTIHQLEGLRVGSCQMSFPIPDMESRGMLGYPSYINRWKYQDISGDFAKTYFKGDD
jgi:hypothetical protein